MSIEVREDTPLANRTRVVDTVLIRSLLTFFEHEHFGIISANLPDSVYTKPSMVDNFLPDVIATNTRGATVYGVAIGCQSIDDPSIIQAIQLLAKRTQVFLIAPEACGERIREMKQTVFGFNNINLLSI